MPLDESEKRQCVGPIKIETCYAMRPDIDSQPRNAIFQRGMGGEQTGHGAPGQGVDDEEVGRLRRGLHGDTLGGEAELFQSRSQALGVAAHLGAAPVCGIFARARNRHLNNRGRQRCQDSHQDKPQHPAPRLRRHRYG